MELVEWLPERAPYHAALLGGQAWSRDTELLAQLVEVASVAATERHRLRQPIDIERPRYAAQQAEPASSPAEIAAFFGMTYRPAQPGVE